jgi:type IV pilus assembly protein PilW
MNRKLQHGVTLVELMVSLTIGLLIVLVITEVYMNSVGVKRNQDDATQVSESARFAFALISREIKMAGFSNVWEQGSGRSKVFCSTQPTNVLSAPNQGAAFAGLNDIASIDPSLMSTTGGTQIVVLNSSDALRVSFFGESSANTSPVADCHGYPVAANQLVNEVLFIAADPTNGGEPALYCYTDNPTPVTATHPGSVPLVAGVESMQFLYGEDSASSGIVTQYLPWIAGTTVPDHVLSIKASLVVRSPSQVTSESSPTAKIFSHFDNGAGYPATANSDTGAVFTAPADRRIRQLVATEIATRNVCK